jgi:Cu/Ag efflux protein CusF
MKKHFITLAWACTTLAAPAFVAAQQMDPNMPGMQHDAKSADAQGRAIVKAIDKAKNTITLQHEAITSIGWPAMTNVCWSGMRCVGHSLAPFGHRLMTTQLVLQSALTCPHCGHQTIETMPTDACQFFYDCAGCGELLRPKAGDCCVFCSYGSVPCPPIQQQKSCCG